MAIPKGYKAFRGLTMAISKGYKAFRGAAMAIPKGYKAVRGLTDPSVVIQSRPWTYKAVRKGVGSRLLEKCQSTQL